MQSSLRLALRQLCIHQKIQDELAASAELNEIPLAFFNPQPLGCPLGENALRTCWSAPYECSQYYLQPAVVHCLTHWFPADVEGFPSAAV
jgi:hypothetical protein